MYIMNKSVLIFYCTDFVAKLYTCMCIILVKQEVRAYQMWDLANTIWRLSHTCLFIYNIWGYSQTTEICDLLIQFVGGFTCVLVKPGLQSNL